MNYDVKIAVLEGLEEEFKDKIKRVRTERSQTIATAASQSSIAESTWRRAEKGHRIRQSTVDKIQGYLDKREKMLWVVELWKRLFRIG